MELNSDNLLPCPQCSGIGGTFTGYVRPHLEIDYGLDAVGTHVHQVICPHFRMEAEQVNCLIHAANDYAIAGIIAIYNKQGHLDIKHMIRYGIEAT